MDFSNLKDKEVDAKESFSWQDFLIKNKLSLILGLIGIFLLGVGVLSTIILSSKNQASEIEILPVQENKEKEIYVHITGAVQKPGLYKLVSDARVNDVLIAAGGLMAEADRAWFEKNVNLAQKLMDGVKLYVPFKNEAAKVLNEGEVGGEQTSIFVQESQGKININTASSSQLETLSGIGPSLAQRIIDYRTQHGPFAKIEDITKVSGIGPGIFEKVKDKITVF